ncbi:MAG: hypothetical protein ACRD1V_05785 [Vicinamibacterales bacterium]
MPRRCIGRSRTAGTLDQGVGTIGPARNRRGRCVFLTAPDVSPFGCAYFDAHMDSKEAERRQLWSIQQMRQSDSYAALRRTLAPAEGTKKVRSNR